MGVNLPVGWSGLHLSSIKGKVQPRLLKRASIACSMTGGVMGFLGCGFGRWSIEESVGIGNDEERNTGCFCWISDESVKGSIDKG